jgi:hypothetical protein
MQLQNKTIGQSCQLDEDWKRKVKEMAVSNIITAVEYPINGGESTPNLPQEKVQQPQRIDWFAVTRLIVDALRLIVSIYSEFC